MSEAEVTLYYFPLAGRGEFIRVLLEEAGVKYNDVTDIPLIKDHLMANKHDGYPIFAPPIIKDGNMYLAQTPVICRYLGKKYGLWPTNVEDEWHADQVNATIHDFIAEGRLVFHGRCFTESYYTQKEETKPYIEWFKAGRLERWLTSLQTSLAANNGGKGFVVGESITYVDLALLHILRATASQFPEDWGRLSPTIPLLTSFKARMSARPRLAAYFKSDRCRPFEGNSMM